MFIKEFFSNDLWRIEHNLEKINNGTPVVLNCTVETNYLPSSITITLDGGSPLDLQKNTTSLSIVIGRADCNDIGEYTCELEDIVKKKIEQVIFPVWVQGCPPVLCENQPKIHNISDRHVTNWSLEVCFRYVSDETVYNIELFLLQNATIIQMENNRQYVYNKLKKEQSLLNLYYNITILNASPANVGKYEMKFHFFGNYLVTYNFEIIVEGLSVHQDNNNLPLQLGLPIIIVAVLFTLGALIRRHILKKERTFHTGKENASENIDPNMEYYEILEDKDVSFKIKEESSKSFLENQKTKIIVERCTESCQSNEHETKPKLPPRSRSKSDYQQLDATQNCLYRDKYSLIGDDYTEHRYLKLNCKETNDMDIQTESETDKVLEHALTILPANGLGLNAETNANKNALTDFSDCIWDIGTNISLGSDDYITPIDSDTYINVKDNKGTDEYITPIDSDTSFNVKDNKVKSELKTGDVFNVLSFGKKHNLDFIQSVQILTHTCLDVDQGKSSYVFGKSRCSIEELYVTPVDILYPELQNLTATLRCEHRGILNILEPVSNVAAYVIQPESEPTNLQTDIHLCSGNKTQMLYTDRKKIMHAKYIVFDGSETIPDKIMDYIDFDGAEKSRDKN